MENTAVQSELAPILLFVYNRPVHTLKTLECLRANILADKSRLIIFSDAVPDASSAEAIAKMHEVRQIIRSVQWCQSVEIVEHKTNKGLANSIVHGVTEAMNKYGKAIILEDDLLTSKYFLKYMNEGLMVYSGNKNIYSINGYMFPIKTERVDTVLSPLATSTWGWATWQDRWQLFDDSLTEKELIQKNKLLKNKFNFSDYNYARMLNNQKSWGIKWYYSVFMRNGLGVFPTKTLVSNIGFDGSGTHYAAVAAQPIYDFEIPMAQKDCIDLDFYNKMLSYFKYFDWKQKLLAFLKFPLRFFRKR